MAYTTNSANIVNVSSFPIDPTGVSDSTTATQNALNEFGADGGQLIVPYNVQLAIGGNLTVPPNVTIKGPKSFVGVMTANSFSSNYAAQGGAILLASTATINLSAGAASDGILVFRQGMTFPATDSSAFAGTAFTMIGDESQILHSMVLGFNQAASANGFSKMTFEGMRFDCNGGILINNSGDVCHINKCHGWSYAVYRTGVTAAQLQRSGIAYAISNSNDWTKFSDSFCYGFLTGFETNNSQSVSFSQCSADNTANAYGTGFAIIGSSADIEMLGCQAAAQVNGFYFNNSGFASRMTGCTAWGNTTNGVMMDTLSGDVNIVGGEVRNSPNGISYNNAAARLDVSGGFRMDGSVTTPFNVGVSTSSIRIDESCDFTNFSASNALIGTPANVIVPNVASAASVTLPWTGDLFNITGTTNFGTLFGGYAGRTVTLVFQGALSVFNSTGAQTAMKLNGSTTFSPTANSTLTLRHNGVQWYEIGRNA